LTLNEDYQAFVNFQVPSNANADGAIYLRDGKTNSVVYEIPVMVALDDIVVSFSPESGKMLRNATNVVYFEAKNSQLYPIALDGVILEKCGVAAESIATFRSTNHGMGKFSINY